MRRLQVEGENTSYGVETVVFKQEDKNFHYERDRM
jgi:hypothetical protein